MQLLSGSQAALCNRKGRNVGYVIGESSPCVLKRLTLYGPSASGTRDPEVCSYRKVKLPYTFLSVHRFLCVTWTIRDPVLLLEVVRHVLTLECRDFDPG